MPAVISIYILLVIYVIPSLSSSSTTTATTTNATLSSIGYNYAITLNISSTSSIYDNSTATTFIVDTGNGGFTVLRNDISSADVNIIKNDTECTFLFEDNTNILYYTTGGDNAFISCSVGTTVASIESAYVSTNITIAKSIEIDNHDLHPWELADGDIGLGYCFDPYYGPCNLTPFQSLLMNISGYDSNYIEEVNQGLESLPPTLIFGLDFENSKSSMQLGYFDSTFDDSIVWQKQANQYPEYHIVFIDNLTICGNNILSSIANNWGVLIDTGSVCLTLPEEIYNVFISWIDLSPINDANELPTFQFSVGNKDFYIPLSSLLVNESMISVESGAPSIKVNSIDMHICVLQGDPITSSSEIYGSGMIVFGTLVLQKIYIAADFGSKSVGFASKVSSAEISKFSTSSCMAPVICPPQQIFNDNTNSCTFSCDTFIFTAYNEKTKTCTYSRSAVGFGFFIIFIIIFMEVTSYFVLQYSAVQLLHEGNGNLNSSRYFGITKIDYLTHSIGKFLTYIIDMLTDYLNDNRNNNVNIPPIAPPARSQQQTNILNHRV